MAETYKVLAQSDPTATTLTDVYTVPSSTSAVVSTVVVANRANAKRTFRLSVAIAGAVDTSQQYLIYDAELAANEVQTYTLGITLSATDKIRAYVSAQSISFNIFGTEIT
jgi:hypothetical protein